jgi:glyoxylase-like metal-dependent hydrolase (beta-lactamase superfamily II)
MPWHGAKIVRWLERSQLKPDVLLITHGHIDHYGGAAHIHTAYPGIKVYGPKAGHHCMKLGRVIVPKELGKTPKWLVSALHAAAAKIHIQGVGCEGDGSELEHLGIRIIPTPGHSPDHTSILLPKGILLAGDAVGDPPGYVNGFLDSLEQSQASLKKLEGEDITRVIPSHGPEFRGPIKLG